MYEKSPAIKYLFGSRIHRNRRRRPRQQSVDREMTLQNNDNAWQWRWHQHLTIANVDIDGQSRKQNEDDEEENKKKIDEWIRARKKRTHENELTNDTKKLFAEDKVWEREAKWSMGNVRIHKFEIHFKHHFMLWPCGLRQILFLQIHKRTEPNGLTEHVNVLYAKR